MSYISVLDHEILKQTQINRQHNEDTINDENELLSIQKSIFLKKASTKNKKLNTVKTSESSSTSHQVPVNWSSLDHNTKCNSKT